MTPARALFLSLAFGAVIAGGAMMLRARSRAPQAPPVPQAWAGIEFAGCAAVTRGPTCELPADGRLRLWAPARASAPLRASADHAPLAVTSRRESDGGSAFEVVVPAGARSLEVLGEADATWSLALAPSSAPTWAEEIARLRESGDLEAVRARVRALLESAAGVNRARLEGLLARTELARSDYASAIDHFRSAIALDRAEGLLSGEAEDTFALSFTLDQRTHRYSDARAALPTAHDAIAQYPEGMARLPFYEGVILEDTADLHSALQRFEEAQRRAERLGMTRPRRNAETSYALELAAIGARDEALARLRALADTSDEGLPCDRAAILDAIGIWTLRSLDETDGTAHPSAATRLESARAAFIDAAALYPRACADAHRYSEVVLGLAEVALRMGDLTAARARLGEARAVLRTPVPSLEILDVEARLATAEHDPRGALEAYDAEERAAGESLPPELGYASAVGRGEAMEAMGRSAEALAQYERAERLLDEQSLWIPLNYGRLAFLADRERSARDRVDLLLRLGRAADAMAAARQSRVRAVAMFEHGARLQSLDPDQRARWEGSLEKYRRLRDRLEERAGDEWKLPQDGVARERAGREALERELRLAIDGAFAVLAQARVVGPAEGATPGEGEVLLAYHPARSGWIGFAQRGAAVSAFRFELPAPSASKEQIAARLVEPARALLADARRVHVLSCGALRAFDLHALPFDGGALLDRAVVTYGTDGAPAARAQAGDPKRALIVADPNDNLTGSIEEAARVERAIRAASGWSTSSLVRDDATSARVREGLGEASWFHYAGHGTFDAHHGLGSALVLANGTRLTVGDVLALPEAPASVVLAGCDTARAGGSGAAAGLGIAQAFVAAGARVAIAPVRPVEDATTAALVARLYRRFGAPDFDLASALRDAQREMRDASPGSDWSAFRAVTP